MHEQQFLVAARYMFFQSLASVSYICISAKGKAVHAQEFIYYHLLYSGFICFPSGAATRDPIGHGPEDRKYTYHPQPGHPSRQAKYGCS
jgi:hypothetical protein